jgi:hypothetical protein
VVLDLGGQRGGPTQESWLIVGSTRYGLLPGGVYERRGIRFRVKGSRDEEVSRMTRALCVLLPSESKRLIARAVVKMPQVRQAFEEGWIVIGRDTTNAYVAEELLREPLEKLIPSVIEASLMGGQEEFGCATGRPCALMSIVNGTVLAEVDALRIMAGVEAVHFASGGVFGSEGAVVLAITGESSLVSKALRLVESMKGEPPLRLHPDY